MDVQFLPLKPCETLTWALCPGCGLRCAHRMWRHVPKEPKQSSGNSHFKPEHPSQMGEGAGWGSAVLLLGRAVLVQLPGLGLCLPCSWELQFCAHMDNQQLQILRRSFCHQGSNSRHFVQVFFPVNLPSRGCGQTHPCSKEGPQ